MVLSVIKRTSCLMPGTDESSLSQAIYTVNLSASIPDVEKSLVETPPPTPPALVGPDAIKKSPS